MIECRPHYNPESILNDPDNSDSTRISEGFAPETIEMLQRPDYVYNSEEGAFYPQWNAAATKKVWLTFDDGPHGTYTNQILSTLATAGAKATFFMVGVQVKAYSSVAKRVFDAGHRVGNHTWSHKNLTTLAEGAIREEIRKADEVLAPYLGSEKILRQPYGATNALVDKVIRDLGYRSVLWTVDTKDWHADYQPTRWMDYGLDQVEAKDHCVILMHDIQKTTAANLPMFVSSLKQVMGGASFQPPLSL